MGNPPFSNSFGLAVPIAEIPKGIDLQYTVYFTDLTYKGNCKFAYSLTAAEQPGFIAYAAFQHKTPAATGPATLSGSVTCGATVVTDTETLYLD